MLVGNVGRAKDLLPYAFVQAQRLDADLERIGLSFGYRNIQLNDESSIYLYYNDGEMRITIVGYPTTNYKEIYPLSDWYPPEEEEEETERTGDIVLAIQYPVGTLGGTKIAEIHPLDVTDTSSFTETLPEFKKYKQLLPPFPSGGRKTFNSGSDFLGRAIWDAEYWEWGSTGASAPGYYRRQNNSQLQSYEEATGPQFREPYPPGHEGDPAYLGYEVVRDDFPILEHVITQSAHFWWKSYGFWVLLFPCGDGYKWVYETSHYRRETEITSALFMKPVMTYKDSTGALQTYEGPETKVSWQILVNGAGETETNNSFEITYWTAYDPVAIVPCLWRDGHERYSTIGEGYYEYGERYGPVNIFGYQYINLGDKKSIRTEPAIYYQGPAKWTWTRLIDIYNTYTNQGGPWPDYANIVTNVTTVVEYDNYPPDPSTLYGINLEPYPWTDNQEIIDVEEAPDMALLSPPKAYLPDGTLLYTSIEESPGNFTAISYITPYQLSGGSWSYNYYYGYGIVYGDDCFAFIASIIQGSLPEDGGVRLYVKTIGGSLITHDPETYGTFFDYHGAFDQIIGFDTSRKHMVTERYGILTFVRRASKTPFRVLVVDFVTGGYKSITLTELTKTSGVYQYLMAKSFPGLPAKPSGYTYGTTPTPSIICVQKTYTVTE